MNDAKFKRQKSLAIASTFNDITARLTRFTKKNFSLYWYDDEMELWNSLSACDSELTVWKFGFCTDFDLTAGSPKTWEIHFK